MKNLWVSPCGLACGQVVDVVGPLGRDRADDFFSTGTRSLLSAARAKATWLT